MMLRLGRNPLLLVVAAVALFAVGGAAFAAANTTNPSSAGEDLATAISGFTITNIVYTLDGTDPTLIDTVTFTAQSGAGSAWPAALTTRVSKFTATANEWYTCTDDAGGVAAGTYVITCTTDGSVNTGNCYNGTTACGQLTVAGAIEFDTILVQ